MDRKLFVTLAGVLLLSAAAWGQSTSGTLVGNVKDASGAVVPNATVVVTEVNTNISKTGTTDNLGNYEIPNLLPGTYDVAVTAQGFKKFVQHGAPLDPRATLRVDSTLEVGATQTVVEVNAAPPVITTEAGTVSDVENNQQIAQLPFNYRAGETSPLVIVSTLPGVQVDPSGVGGISISGSHPTQNEYSVDGFSVSSPRYNGPLAEMFPSTEQIAEVKVTSQAGNAEYGPVGDISFVGKSGANDFHGSLFEYLQNDALDAIPPFANGKPKKRDNSFGGSISGPVILPGYKGKDKTFFFFDWESNRKHSTLAQTQAVPAPAMLNGDFSAFCSEGGGTFIAGICSNPAKQLINPFNGSPYANNQIPGPFNATSLNILSTFYAAANSATTGDALTTSNNFRFNFPAPVTTNLFDVRVDRNLTSKQSIYGRFSWKKITQSFPLGLSLGPQDQHFDPKAFILSYNYSLRPNLLNELRFGHNRQTTLVSYPKFPDGAKLVTQTIGFQQLGPFPKGSGIPGISFEGISGITGTPGTREEALREHKYQIADNLTWIRGRHTFKMGLDVRELRSADFENFIGSDNFGNYHFRGVFTGYDFADFLLGLPAFTEIVNAGPDFDGHARAYGFFGQDTFKVTPKLTLNYGVRYEYHPPFHDDTLQIANFNRATGAVVVPNAASLALATPIFLQSINACGLPVPQPPPYAPTAPCTPVQTAQQAGIPSTLRFGDKKGILPRLSLAYRVSDKWVVRAGAGMYDETILGTIFYSLTGIHTSDYRAFINSSTAGVPAIQFPNTRTSNGAVNGGPAGSAVFGTANQIDFHNPYAEQWTLTVERDLGWQTGLRVTYTGMRSVGLATSPDLNQIPAQTTPYDPAERPWPNWSVLKSRDNGGSAMYNGLETVVTHRFSQGLNFQTSWVWSKNLSDAEGGAANGGGFTGENGYRVSDRFHLHSNYGNVAYTRRHRWLTTATWEIPMGRGKKYGSSMEPVLDKILGGWQTTHILLFQTGPYLTPYMNGGEDPSGTNAPNRPGTQRPDRLPSSDPACSGLKVMNGSCFFFGWPGQIGRFGNSGVGIFTGQGTKNWNFGLAKNIPITERYRLRFETTFSNFLNHPNLDIPNMAADSGNFSVISSPQGVEGLGSRIIQFALRLDF